MNTNNVWLRKQCTAFLNSKLNDIELSEKAGLIREAARKRGISQDEVGEMYRTINKEKKNES